MRVTTSLLLALFAAGFSVACGPDEETVGFTNSQLQVRLSDLDDPSSDLRWEALLVLQDLRAGGTGYGSHLPGGLNMSSLTVPTSIRVWRRSLGGSDSCTGQVDVLDMEDYVKGVLPHEWITSWEVESLRAGSIAIRTYASYWVEKGGKYDCADICDTAHCQVYKDGRNTKASDAVDHTKGKLLVENGNLVFAEYSAENGDPTLFGVSDPHCPSNGCSIDSDCSPSYYKCIQGQCRFGHGRGMCQWGSQRWALQGQGYLWITEHYYPGAAVLDTTAPPLVDAGVVDQAMPLDQAMPVDSAVDKGLIPVTDGGGFLPPLWPADSAMPPEGGCSLSSDSNATTATGVADGLGALFCLLCLAGFRRRV